MHEMEFISVRWNYPRLGPVVVRLTDTDRVRGRLRTPLRCAHSDSLVAELGSHSADRSQNVVQPPRRAFSTSKVAARWRKTPPPYLRQTRDASPTGTPATFMEQTVLTPVHPTLRSLRLQAVARSFVGRPHSRTAPPPWRAVAEREEGREAD